MKPEVIRCKTCGRKRSRSSGANARYWLLLHMIADKVTPENTAYAAETWHKYFKSRFLGMNEFTLPNKKVVQFPKSTADLYTQEFNDYMMHVEAWANERGVYMDSMEEMK